MRIRLNIAILSLALFLLFWIPTDFIQTRSQHELWNLGHILLFASLTTLFWQWFSQTDGKLQRYLYVFLFSALTAGISEWLQQWFNRGPSLKDFGLDLVGIITALVFLTRASSRLTTTLRIGICLLILACFKPSATALLDELNAAKEFPVLADFNNARQKTRFRSSLNSVISKSGMSVTFDRSRYATLYLENFPRNWQDFQSLKIELNNLEKRKILLTCHLHDKQHTQHYQYEDRFVKQFLIRPGPQRISLNLHEAKSAPQNRKMNMQNIHTVACFTQNLKQTAVITFKEFYLTKTSSH